MLHLEIPLHEVDDDAPPPPDPTAGRALCLSGGGYRAMLFHLGGLWRLNECGMLPALDCISSVSGGSMVAAWLGLRWSALQWSPGGEARNFEQEIVGPIRALADTTLDWKAFVAGAIVPGYRANDAVVAKLGKHLFGKHTLQDLPERPHFVINATNLQTGKLWRFSRPYMGDWTIGLIRNPDVPLAKAVAASAAFPPVLSPSLLQVDPRHFDPKTAGENTLPPFMDTLILSDGGVYDNLGLEAAFKQYRTLLVSDAGMRPRADADMEPDFLPQLFRVYDTADAQVRALRKRQLIFCFNAKTRNGAYFSSNSRVARFPAKTPLHCPPERTVELANTPTRLKAMPAALQERLINWGYAICDVAIRSHVDPTLPSPSAFPYARGV